MPKKCLTHRTAALSKPAPPSPTSMRLNKAISSTGYCSRRNADELIFGNKVKINGVLENNPARQVSFKDILEVNGSILKYSSSNIYLIMNKPIQTVCTVKDPQGRTTVIDLLPNKFKKYRVFPVGRLDYFSEGLLLLTNDGDLAQRLMHPRYHQPKTYEVLIRGPVSPEVIQDMEDGMTINDIKLLPVKINIQILKNGNTLLQMELRQGINRQIRKMCEEYNLIILRLRRLSQSGLTLSNLKPGECRELTPQEVHNLRNSVNI